MTSRLRSCVRTDREGQTLAITAVMMVALLALLGLGIDLGMAYTARAEAQRVADSAALAGASAFLEFVDPLDAVGLAEDRAREYAGRNVVRNRPVDPNADVEVQVVPAEQRVRVWVRRTDLPVWFARLVGENQLNVRAMAAARAMEAGSSPCIMPFAAPDMWDERSGDDLADNRIFNFDNELPYNGDPKKDPNEYWQYEPQGHNPEGTLPDVYRPRGEGELNPTGYGSDWRHQANPTSVPSQDDGLRVLLKPQATGHNQLNNWWQFWKPAGNSNSYNDIRQMIQSGECYDISDLTGVGGNITPVPGDRAVVYSDIVDFIDDHDPELRWDDDTNMPYDPNDPTRNVWKSKRVISVPVVHPDVLLRSSNNNDPLEIVNIITLFLEDPRVTYGGKPKVDNSVAITGRIMHRGTGAIGGEGVGTIERVLRLVE